MITDLQPNLQYITYDIIHMFMGEKYKQNAIFLYRKKMSLLKQLQNVTLVRRGFRLCVQK